MAAQPPGAEVVGTVVDLSGGVLPGASVTLTAEPVGGAGTASVVNFTVTDGRGRFIFPGVDPGRYALTVELFGYARTVHGLFELSGGESTDLRIELALASVTEVVTVDATTGAGVPIEEDRFESDFLRVFQLPGDRFQDALPLLPGVVRDPRGRLSFNGTRASQSTLLVNGTNATDPVTGQFAIELPLSVVDTVEVHAVPYSAEFGRVSGAVTEIRTRAGDDSWQFDFDSLFPSPRFRGGKLNGINTATPRVQVSGPLSPGRAWISQAVSYRFVRSEVKEPIIGEDEEIVEGIDIFTQIDLRLNDRHSLTGTFSAFPTTVDNMEIDSIRPAVATPEADIGGWNVAVVDEFVADSNTLWRTRFAARGFDVAVRPQASGVARLGPDGLRGNYFNEIDRQSTQLEFGTARLRGWRLRGQEHLVKIGAEAFVTSFDGTDRSGPIEVVGADGGLLKRITFEGDGVLSASDVMTSAFIQDHWQVTPRLALDLGLRYDFSSMLSDGDLSPRLAFSLALDPGRRTVVKGGWGFYFDQIFLQVDAFESFQRRVEQQFAGSPASPLGPPVVFENRLDPDGLDEPRSWAWNIELDRQLTPSLLLRVNYRENQARDRLLINRVRDATDAALVLSSNGSLTSREFDATLRWTLEERGDLFFSFSKIRATGDLNDFGLVYDNHREPLVLDNATARQPFEVPNRLLMWGLLELPYGLTVTPGIEWRDGFLFTVFNEDYSVAGERNSTRFPSFLSVDVAVNKRMELFGRRFSVGLQLYNLTNRHNPRDVISNLASSHFGEFRNSVDTSVSLKLGVGL